MKTIQLLGNVARFVATAVPIAAVIAGIALVGGCAGGSQARSSMASL